MKKKRKELELLKKAKEQEIASKTINVEPAILTSNSSNTDKNKNLNNAIKSSIIPNPKQSSKYKKTNPPANNNLVKEIEKKSDLNSFHDTEESQTLNLSDYRRPKSKKKSVPDTLNQGSSFAPIFEKLEEKQKIKENKMNQKAYATNKIPNSKEKKASKPKDSNKILEKYIQLFTSKIVGRNVLVEINTMHQSMKEDMEKLKKKIKDTEDEVKEGEKKEEINNLYDNISKIEQFLKEHVNNDFLKIVKENTELTKENQDLEKKLFNLKETLKNEEEEYGYLDKNFDEVILEMQEEIKFAEQTEDQLIEKIKNQGGDLIHVVNDICQRDNNYDYSYKDDEIE